MKNKKGFTLIEITIAVLILAAISLIAIPVVKTVINNSRQRAYNIARETIEDAAKSYHYMHSSELKDELENNGVVTITMNQLKTEGFITKDIENPIDNTIMNNNVIIIRIAENQYEYDYVEN